MVSIAPNSFWSRSLLGLSCALIVSGLAFAQSADNPRPDDPSVGADTVPQLRAAPLDPPAPQAVPEVVPETDDPTLKVPDLDLEGLNPFRAIDPLENPPASTLEDLAGAADAQSDEVAITGSQQPDYSRLSSSAERVARLDRLFETLAQESDAENANLIAEEIWAIWLDSGSASVNFILRRGTTAQKAGDQSLARRLYDQVTTLAPEFAEGWSRSGRLALEEKDFSRALTDTTEVLIREPRHFYALWTLGNIFEHLGRNDEALEVYSEANTLYPELKAVKDRVEMMRDSVEGDVL